MIKTQSSVELRLGEIPNWVDGQCSWGSGDEFSIEAPATGEVVACSRSSNRNDIAAAAQSSANAQLEWAKQTSQQRSQILFAYRQQLEQHGAELAEICHIENGKSLSEAQAGVSKAIELVDFACSLPFLASGRVQLVSRGIECREELLPVGVTSSICPSNFPIMVPHWTTPLVLALGNSVLLKPSELTPACALKMAQLWQKAGLPDGLLNIINGSRETVEALCDEPLVKALSFVGSTPVAEKVFQRCSQNLKRVATFGGAKNHIILLPDAHPDMAYRDILASFTGMAGQRCMAASVLIAVGKVEAHIESLLNAASKMEAGKDLPPMITRLAIDKISDYLNRAAASGANILLDGRKQCRANDAGNLLGPSIIDYRNGTELPKEEVFGPTLEIVAARNISEAVAIQRSSPYGNGAAVFTQNGKLAAEVISQLSAGMVGVNIGIPVPREPFSFGGMNASHFGYADITGEASIPLWTQRRKITTKWNPQDRIDWMS